LLLSIQWNDIPQIAEKMCAYICVSVFYLLVDYFMTFFQQLRLYNVE